MDENVREADCAVEQCHYGKVRALLDAVALARVFEVLDHRVMAAPRIREISQSVLPRAAQSTQSRCRSVMGIVGCGARRGWAMRLAVSKANTKIH